MSVVKRNKARGKEAEKRFASIFGGVRMGLFGAEDISHEVFSIEVKSREKFVGTGWFKQCVKNNKRGKIPLVIVIEKHQQADKGLRH